MIIPILLLLSLSVTVIYSSSPQLAVSQAIFSLIGIALFFILRSFDFRIFKSLSIGSYLITLLLLIIVFILGFESRGSTRWIDLGFFNFQPSELAKLVLILCLAHFWSVKLPTWKNIGFSLLILLPFTLLIFKQPDLGTALTVTFIWVTMLIAANISWKKVFILGFLGTIILPLVWIFLRDYQKQRIYSFLSPSSDPLGIGYNVIQSVIAVGSGQFFGRGIGQGTQSRLQFLPEFRTDFIFAFIAEELGFLGSVIVILLYATILILLIRLMNRSGNRFGELIVAGIIGMMLFQVTVNIGMNIGIMPVTGITLPLLSYGGSSVIVTLMSFGIADSIRRFGLKKKSIEVFGLQ
ncbi:MAG: Rod shape-determining protein RodA [Candidatus Daviesbacteria bacterium GW2011_GWA2_38_24]|uniref:Rod shape-determining protein RodA n=1 Tax=Candidatus Daviesbacteria bacterium GW2011_GWA2_38_24 TaxID=1618422 RepID=A0A0G0MQG6_9BACT|nr:MAG: Rod shape-determining protein RodA [Candidatus Daviesbacteria bacterium GW2011_GWA2_38_24]KKQ79183.1 MAG: Rod shape-determining protein RodA [Candidatus Daviesbacteria bacterium GW2011_GWA1_38_7]OGE23506.1 MAG: rod shape-determining protein RodA [Candidatus Daviesbacteria bacterium RIFCSPHIGHO2_01_FULL_38_8]